MNYTLLERKQIWLEHTVPPQLSKREGTRKIKIC